MCGGMDTTGIGALPLKCRVNRPLLTEKRLSCSDFRSAGYELHTRCVCASRRSTSTVLTLSTLERSFVLH